MTRRAQLLHLAALFVMAPPLAAIQFTGEAPAPEQPLTLWYRRPAERWVEALPVGNGRLGAMVFGGVFQERLQLNEDTLWAGGPYDPNRPRALAALPELRRLIFAGKYREASALAASECLGDPPGQMPYQPFADLWLEFPHQTEPTQYRRELDLDSAIAHSEFELAGVRHTRDLFASAADQVLVLRLCTDRPGALDFDAWLTTAQPADPLLEPSTLVLRGHNRSASRIPGQLAIEARVELRLADGGTLELADGRARIRNASSVTLLIAAATSYRRYDDVSGDPRQITFSQLQQIQDKTYAELRDRHVLEHRRLFRRVDLDFG